MKIIVKELRIFAANNVAYKPIRSHKPLKNMPMHELE